MDRNHCKAAGVATREEDCRKAFVESNDTMLEVKALSLSPNDLRQVAR